MTRQCPHDRAELLLDSHEGMTGYRCSQCDGAWLPSSCWEKLELECEFSAEKFTESLIANRHKQSLLSCPVDAHSLQSSCYQNIELDWCPRCFGIWFDRTELANLREPLIYSKKDGSVALVGLELLYYIIIAVD